MATREGVAEQTISPATSERAARDARRARFLYGVSLAIFALLYALAFFQGLEHQGGYRGNSFKAIHPESFPGDRYVTGRHPTMVSLVYVVAHIAGDLWLDDRFQLAWYLGLVILAIAAVDRLAVLFGASTPLERLAVLALVLVAHHFKTNFAQLVPSSGTPTAAVHPIGLWVAYLLFRGDRLFAAMALSGLMVLIAPKNGWYPAMIAFVFWLRERWHVPWKRIAVGVALSLVTLFVGFALVNRGNREAGLLFDLWDWYEDGEANPFRDSLAGNGLYLLLILGAMRAACGSGVLQARCLAFFTIALAAFFLGGVYYTYAPDVMKIPILVGMSVNRTSWWPQQLSYLVLGCYAVRLFDRGARRTQVLAALLLGGLYLTPIFESRSTEVSSFFIKRSLLLLCLWSGLALMVVATRAIRASPRRVMAKALPAKASLFLLPIVLTTTVYLLRCVHTQRPSLQFLTAHGVMGNASSAKWVGVDDYLRTQTSPTASVLALSRDRDGIYGADDALRVRTGRPMPITRPASTYLSYEMASRYFEQQWLWEELARHWERHDWPGVSQRLAALGSPEYFVVPADGAQWLRGVPDLDYRVEATIRGVLILRRTDAGAARAASPSRES
ncbi:MAG: hypothetical protein HYY58_04345 [Candidatus Omnitrophica bacterium]|nr:hypothetical protein [Candidatus Omnitrophota bacterium]